MQLNDFKYKDSSDKFHLSFRQGDQRSDEESFK